MNMKLGKITLYMFGRKFGEEYANRLAEQFTDQEIADYAAEFKKLSISEKRKMANAKSLESRWGKKPEPVIQPTPAPVREEVQSQEPIPVIEEAPADYVDPIQREATAVVNRLEHQTYTDNSKVKSEPESKSELDDALTSLGIDCKVEEPKPFNREEAIRTLDTYCKPETKDCFMKLIDGIHEGLK